MFRIVVNKLSGSARGRGFKPRQGQVCLGCSTVVEDGENPGQVPP